MHSTQKIKDIKNIRPSPLVQKWTPGPCVHTVVTSSVTVHRFVIAAKLMFLMASEREKWSNYVHSCISGTHGTHAVVPGRAPSLDSPSEK